MSALVPETFFCSFESMQNAVINSILHTFQLDCSQFEECCCLLGAAVSRWLCKPYNEEAKTEHPKTQ